MTNSVIQVENLSKLYHIGKTKHQHNTLRDTLAAGLRAPLDWLRRSGRNTGATDEDTLWALKDVSFEVQRGEVIGIIGPNGAGKSTLLKIMSRVTEPTKGRVVVVGRVGSLLEVGTGFHPELSGRENVYFSGAILGMHRQEIARKFDEIVAFAEIERFLDMPVKRYSSGMYVRLAFAVAAHLEPETLLVDEVLAVGDLAFQQKCLNHMRNLTTSGMTVLLVSHNMAAIQSSCDRALHLDRGILVASGDPLKMIASYRQSLRGRGGDPEPYFGDDGQQMATSGVSILGFEMFDEKGGVSRDVKFGEPTRIRIDLQAKRRIENPFINFGIKRGDGVIVCNFNNWYDNFKIDYIEGRCTLEGWLPPLRLVPDYYEAHVLVWPWGGNHSQGDMTRSMPLAAAICGDFHVHGPGLNSHDGVFQLPAQRWRFSRGSYVLEDGGIVENSLHAAFDELGRG